MNTFIYSWLGLAFLVIVISIGQYVEQSQSQESSSFLKVCIEKAVTHEEFKFCQSNFGVKK